MEQMIQELPARLAQGKARVVKQRRGNCGIGVWKVQFSEGVNGAPPQPESMVRVRHAKRGCTEEEITQVNSFSDAKNIFSPMAG